VKSEKETTENPEKSRHNKKKLNYMVVENLKRIGLLFTLLIFSVVTYAQKDVTKFLGIPVDGSKSEMMQKLKSKGFTNSPQNKDVLVGEFNGRDAELHIVTNNNKVYRIMVRDVYTSSERDIKIRFNRLCRQFEKNEKYKTVSLSSDYIIPDDEDISYEMTVKNKRYEASYYQMPEDFDADKWLLEVQSSLLSKYSDEQLSNPTEEIESDLLDIVFFSLIEKYSKKSVWFIIDEQYGKYRILMYYDNEYNSANGDDL
jgi:hypothetical protein